LNESARLPQRSGCVWIKRRSYVGDAAARDRERVFNALSESLYCTHHRIFPALLQSDDHTRVEERADRKSVTSLSLCVHVGRQHCYWLCTFSLYDL